MNRSQLLLDRKREITHALRGVVFVLTLLLLLAGSGAAGQSFSLDDVRREAAALAADPYRPPARPVASAELGRIGYDQFQALRFLPENALWHDGSSRFRVQFFPTAFIYGEAVAVNLVAAGKISPIVATPSWFDWTAAKLKPPEAISLAGFKILFPLHQPQTFDEVAVFLGASYFRLLGREQVFGQSARGLAIDTALAKGEEFPVFRKFWIVAGDPAARELTILALLDSPALTGAYRFVLRPGSRTHADVEFTLYARHDVSVVGIAPLTSMFLAGEASRRRDSDFRPEIHDSDGLLIAQGNGERVWRPLANATELAVNSFLAEKPSGFGLLQRDRDFDHYQDLQAQYHRRPSFWIEPRDDWGAGEIRLIEIPTQNEFNDNVVAFWVGRDPIRGGTSLSRSYRISALTDEATLSPMGHVVATRLADAQLAGGKGVRRIVVDFAGGELGLLRPAQPVAVVATVLHGKIRNQRVEAIPANGIWRVTLDVEPDGRKPPELRAFLTLDGDTLTETWSFAVRP